ncbi:P-loop NTPase fold protein [Cellulomonas composti]|uniref:KAP NTPase domain-containing protein n=1 Tax=Cellulomonas composti TaxID=266130 RepID=A0A511JAR7_9CELL|nr:P-loop NTPase fold protein [Cellulomonas composti]GEL94869.1 hypothetical protein CCO02nite_15270 [Cellulomonas composti]
MATKTPSSSAAPDEQERASREPIESPAPEPTARSRRTKRAPQAADTARDRLRIEVSLGDVVAAAADVLVVPAFQDGPVAGQWERVVGRLGVSDPPGRVRSGQVVPVDVAPDSGRELVVLAGTVPPDRVAGRVTLNAIEEVGAALGRHLADRGLRTVATPDLVMSLPGASAVPWMRSLEQGWRSSAPDDARLLVVVDDEAAFDELAKLYPTAARDPAREPASTPTPDPTLAPEPAQVAAGLTNLVHDQPASSDELGRASLANELASLFRELAAAHDRPEAFAAHLDAPWGAGKSTLVGFLADALRTGPQPWTIVSLDAWRSSQLSPAWWALLGQLRTDVRSSLGFWARRRFDVTRFAQALRRLWRIWLPPMVVLVVLGVLWARAVDVSATMSVVTAVVAFAAAMGGLGSRFLSLGSVQGARVHERLTDNPMDEVADQIWSIRRSSPRPILLVLDDLDRCNDVFAVELLDAVQTLLRHAPSRRRPDHQPEALIVLAVGDGRWLRAAYEHAYEVFSPYVSEPGRPLGHLFLDKLFQLRIELPRLSGSQVSGYLTRLLDLREEATDTAGRAANLAAQISAAPEVATTKAQSLDALLSDVMSQATDLPAQQREELADAVLRTRRSDTHRTQRQRHLLEQYAHLLEPNPRATKRFLMSYNVAFAARITEPEPIEPATLALWTVLSTRWPALAEWIRDALPLGGEVRASDESGHPSRLLLEPPVRAVMDSPLGGPLDRVRMLRCCGYPPDPGLQMRADGVESGGSPPA